MERINESDSFEENKKDVCFDDVLNEVKKVAKDQVEAESLLTERIVINLILFVPRKNGGEERKKSVSLSQTLLGFSVPKRKRGSCGKRDHNYQCLVDDFDHNPDEEEEDGRKFRKNNNGNRSFDHIPDRSNNADDEQSMRRSPKKKSMKKVVPSLNTNLEEEEKVIPDMFQRKIDSLGGTDIKLILEKRLSTTDMTKGHNKLSIPAKQVRRTFLTPEEDVLLNQFDEHGHRKGIDVIFFEPSGQRCDNMVLKRWPMSNSSIYALNKGWYSVVLRNDKLKEGKSVEVWSFRSRDNKLGFALVQKSSSGGAGNGSSCVGEPAEPN